MATRLIKGVRVKPLKVIPDERGCLFEMLRRDEPLFQKFGQVYCTAVYRGVVKGWHYHKRQVDNFVCVAGMIKLVLYDGRAGSPTKGLINEFFMGAQQQLLVQIPAGIYHGFKGLTEPEALVINIASEPYHHAKPDEYRLPPHGGDIPYDWARKDG
ncbi:MAG: dTDP-4-dehydrorhamnose 3,5-epimerase family protein [Candidatus Omnitrophica bacterium]|nr:dTDP-4-dehydrorhamnose 3,5-epimerase family protein [Candidatus Omnitrophota bacterium]